MSVAAKVKVTNRVEQADGQVSLSFMAPYTDDNGNRINEDWSKYTPALSMQMTVSADVAHHPSFAMHALSTITFEPAASLPDTKDDDEDDEDETDGDAAAPAPLEDAETADEAVQTREAREDEGQSFR